jgi:hypothetical protein
VKVAGIDPRKREASFQAAAALTVGERVAPTATHSRIGRSCGTSARDDPNLTDPSPSKRTVLSS